MFVPRLMATLLALTIMGPSIQSAPAADVAAQRDLVNSGVVGIISGGISGTYVRIAADLADALDHGYDLRILPIVGKGSVRNVEDLLLLRGIDAVIVQSDVLDFYKRAELAPNIEDRLRYIAKLYSEEVHVLARSEYADIDDVAGKRANFGSEGSGTFMTAGIVFEQLGIDVDISSYPEPIALEKLRDGELDALVFVGGQIKEVGREDGFHLLSIPPERIKGAYTSAELTAHAYPGLLNPGESVRTVA